jgi:hypothetical protein
MAVDLYVGWRLVDPVFSIASEFAGLLAPPGKWMEPAKKASYRGLCKVALASYSVQHHAPIQI